jgi:ferrous iron transport protein B
MWLTFQLTFSAGEIPKSWLESLIKVLIDFTVKIFQPGLFRDLVTDGIISGAGGVIVFLPNILILFFMISLMEDSGYMARAAFIMDRVMHKIGLHGRSFIPLLMGFGCNVPAIMATRTIESRSERILTMMIIPFMSCSARLPVYVVMISAFFPEYPGTMLFAIYLLGSFAAVGTSLVLKKTVFKKSEVPFVMELPPYRSPKLKATARHMWDKAAEYMKKIAGTILIESLVIWALGRIPVKNISNESGKSFLTKEVKLEDSALASVGHFISPAMAPLGFDWKMSVSLLSGFAAKEIVVSTMSVMYNVESKKTGEKTELINKFKEQTFTEGPKTGQKVFTKLTAFGFIIFVLLYFPCVGSISAIRRESGNWKWPVIAVVYTTAAAWLAVFIINQIGIRLI